MSPESLWSPASLLVRRGHRGVVCLVQMWKSVSRLQLLLLLLPVTIALFTLPGCGDGDTGGDSDDKDEPLPFGLTSEVVTPAANADAIAFAPDGRLFFVEHWSGAIRVLGADGQLLPDPFATLSDVATNVNWGLTGLALDPDFSDNHYVYVFYTPLVEAGPPTVVRPTVVRFTDSDNKGVEQLVLVSDLPEADPEHPFNAIGSVHAGPDGNLYLTLGDYDQALATGPTGLPLAQDLGTPIGKMLRISKADGSAPPDNPFVNDPSADPRIFASGFRVPFNFVFHPESGRIYGSDDSGPICEEVNIVAKGLNYGHPQTSETPYSDCKSLPGAAAIYYPAREGFTPEQIGSTVGITGMDFISGSDYPVLGDSLVFCEVGTQHLRRLVLAPPNFEEVTADDVIARDCWLDVTVGPDGFIYYSNLTEIRRLIPSTPTPSPAPTGS
jgi:aldose sugar dehydrogenase